MARVTRVEGVAAGSKQAGGRSSWGTDVRNHRLSVVHCYFAVTALVAEPPRLLRTVTLCGLDGQVNCSSCLPRLCSQASRSASWSRSRTPRAWPNRSARRLNPQLALRDRVLGSRHRHRVRRSRDHGQGGRPGHTAGRRGQGHGRVGSYHRGRHRKGGGGRTSRHHHARRDAGCRPQGRLVLASKGPMGSFRHSSGPHLRFTSHQTGQDQQGPDQVEPDSRRGGVAHRIPCPTHGTDNELPQVQGRRLRSGSLRHRPTPVAFRGCPPPRTTARSWLGRTRRTDARRPGRRPPRGRRNRPSPGAGRP